MNPTQPSASTSANLRPRNRRLISIDDEFETLRDDRPSSRNSTTSSSFPSRTTSPIPSAHPSRPPTRPPSTNNTRHTIQQGGSSLRSFNFGGSDATPSSFATGLWGTSWSSLQGIASTLVGNNLPDPTKDKSTKGRPTRRRRPPEFISGAKLWDPPTLGEWGPSANNERHLAIGSKEDRLAQVQAKKREALLQSNGPVLSDSSGNYKRRLSGDRDRETVPRAEDEDQNALVYVHHVQPNDTLAGISIKYNCPAAVFRKANRLYPNDSVQIRKTVYLPVEACGVRGRKIPEPAETLNALGDCNNEELTPVPTPTAPNHDFGSSSYPKEPSSTTLTSVTTSPSLSATHTSDPPWKHDSWVIIDPSPTAIEIARLPRRTLGFFPPSRRKSLPYSDLDTPSLHPPYDLTSAPRLSSPHRLATSSSRLASPSRRDKARSSSGSQNSYFSSALSGPGGVGSLTISSPGPAQDRLNQIFAPHLPNVAPRTSFESVASTSSTGIEKAGGAIEGWVRKMATKAAVAVQSPGIRGAGVSGGRQGDLIELVEGWDAGGGGGTADTSREREEEEERMLRERFPPVNRGRVFEDKARKRGERNRGVDDLL